MIYDVIIIGAGAAGMFSGITLDKNIKKIILEKTEKAGTKVLMSGGERANISNASIDPLVDYFSQNNKFLLSIFSKFSSKEILDFFAKNNIKIVKEDRSRLILKSGDSKELLDFFLKSLEKNNCPIKYNQNIKNILKNKNEIFEIETENHEKYLAKNVIISTGGKSFPQVGTSGEGYKIAKNLGIEVVPTYRTLCGLSTKKDLSEISGISLNLEAKLFDKNNKKEIYCEKGPLLFTHFGVSGPIVHNISNAIGNYLNRKKIDENNFEKYILENMFIKLKFDLENTPKRVIKFFDLKSGNEIIDLDLQNWRSWKEAKATGGGISTKEFDNNLEVKKIPGLYFVGEVVDVTGKTGGFNLQWAWSSAFVAAKSLNEKIKNIK